MKKTRAKSQAGDLSIQVQRFDLPLGCLLFSKSLANCVKSENNKASDLSNHAIFGMHVIFKFRITNYSRAFVFQQPFCVPVGLLCSGRAFVFQQNGEKEKRLKISGKNHLLQALNDLHKGKISLFSQTKRTDTLVSILLLLYGAHCRTRTYDPLINSQML